MASQTYDIVIAGGEYSALPIFDNHASRYSTLAPSTGGTCACIVAGRLADADPSLRILIVEAGPPTRDDPLHAQPSRYLYHLRPDSSTVRFNVGAPSASLGGRAPIVPCGQCVGGGSSVNCEYQSIRPIACDRPTAPVPRPSTAVPPPPGARYGAHGPAECLRASRKGSFGGLTP